MAFAGGLGAKINVAAIPQRSALTNVACLFSESNTRFLCEVETERMPEFERAMAGIQTARIGSVSEDQRLQMTRDSEELINADVFELKAAWQDSLHW
jgi:phosphoribosylformylglycinamidine synthase subunit PurSL